MATLTIGTRTFRELPDLPVEEFIAKVKEAIEDGHPSAVEFYTYDDANVCHGAFWSLGVHLDFRFIPA